MTGPELPARSLPKKLVPGLAVVTIFGLFLPFLGVPFEYDDKVEIVANEVLRSPGKFGEMWSYNPFRVLLLYTFAADVWAWGILRPEGYRAVNILIHALNTLLLWSMLRRLGAGPTWQAGPAQRTLFTATGTLLFAVHPLAIESVTYVSGRSSSLATTFVLASMVLYIRHRDGSGKPAAAAWITQFLGQANRLLAVGLGAALLTGLPCKQLVGLGWISPRQAVLYTVAATGALLVLFFGTIGRSWLRGAGGDRPPADSQEGRRAVVAYCLAFLAFVLGCVTKEIAAMLPVALLLIEAHWFQSSWRGALATLRGRLFPFFAIPAALLLLRAVTYGYIASPVHIRPVADNALTQVEVIWNYLRLWLLPYPQSIYHDHAVVPPPGTAFTWLCAAALLVVLVLAVRARSGRPALGFGLLFLLATLAPTSSVFALKETMVEHRTYLPSIGYAFAMAWLVSELWTRWLSLRVSAALLGLLLVVYGTLNVSYNILWRSEEVLWSHAVAVNPQASDAWRNLGDLYRSERRMADAIRAYRSAVASRASNIEARTSLAVALALSGKLDEAQIELESAVQAAPCHGPALNNLAMIQSRRGAWDRSVLLYDRSLECDPLNTMAHLGLGHLYYGPLKSRQKAALHYQRFLDLADPLHPSAAPIKERLLELTW